MSLCAMILKSVQLCCCLLLSTEFFCGLMVYLFLCLQAQVCKADVDFALALLDGLLKEGLPGSEAPGESNASAESSSAGVVDKPANVDDAESR